MGFFKDFKRDFAQAVNELMPDKDELSSEYDDEDMVNTFDENDSMDVAPEDMLEDLDDFSIDNVQGEQPKDIPGDGIDYSASVEDEEESDEEDMLSSIPSAEIINDNSDDLIEELDSNQQDNEPEPEMLEAESMEIIDNASKEADEETALDELTALDNLDEENMEENLEEALAVETEESDEINEDFKSVDFDRDVIEAFSKHEEEELMDSLKEEQEEDDMAELETNIPESEKEQDIESILTDDTTYITKGTTIKGDIETDGGIDIIGSVEGNVSCAGKLIIGGTIKGNVKSGEIYANAAKIEGEVVSDGSVKIGVGSVVVGNVSATSAVIAGAVNGDIDVKGPVIVDSTAVIMGNIKSRSVQINNGAVIEGFCSQCYSEIDVKSFFE